MCGIAGLVLYKNFNPGIEMKAETLYQSLQLFKNDTIDINLFFDNVWHYKSNINFIRYYKSEDEKQLILNIIYEISNLSQKFYQRLKKINKALYPQLLENK